MKFKFGMLVAALAVVAFGWVGSGTTSAGNTSGAALLKYELRGAEIQENVPRGKLTFSSSTFDDRILLSLSNVWLDAGTVLTVRVNSTVVGTVTINASHRGKMFLSEDMGATVPDMVGGDAITLRDGPLPGDDLILSRPTDPKFFYMYAKMTGPAVDGRTPVGRVTWKETEYGFARTIRLFMQSVRLHGETLHLVKIAADPQDNIEIGTCVVTAEANQCKIAMALHDDDVITNLTTSAVLKVLDDDDNVIMSQTAWVQVLPTP